MGAHRLVHALCVALAAVLASAGAAHAQDAPAEDDAALQAALGLQDAFTRVAERVFPSVVGITVYRRSASLEDPDAAEGWRASTADPYPGYSPERSGSGVIVSEDGYVLTTYHLVMDGEEGRDDDAIVDVETHDGRHIRARVVGGEATIDLAVIKMDVRLEFQPAVIGDSDAARVGHWAIALGDPEGPGKTFAAGTIAALPERECYQDQLSRTLMQVSVVVPSQAYGGPLVDIRGRVIGLLQPLASPEAGPARAERGAEYALPMKLAMNLYEPLRVRESRRSPWIGISVLELTWDVRREIEKPPLTGIYIDNVYEPSPAAAAGIQVGDVLTSFAGQRMLTVSNFQQWLYLSGIGKRVDLVVSRDGELLEKSLVIEERPPEAVPR